MSRNVPALLLVALAASALALTGCGSGSTLDTEPVKGLVTVDGTPVPGATIVFSPVVEGQGAPATGFSDESGMYTLTATPSGELKGADGAGTTPGEYYVGVIKSISEIELTREEAEKKGVKYNPTPPGKDPKMTYVVPKKYNYPPKSGLKVTVKQGENDIPLELTTK
jgi:hypothetical protein